MTKPIVLYDENRERVGETYPRRAKQLLKSGRALWLEEGHSMLLASVPENSASLPVKEEIFVTETVYHNNGTKIDSAESKEMSNDLLLHLARQNVAEKKSLFRHIIAYIIAWPMLHALYTWVFNGIGRVRSDVSAVSSIEVPDRMIRLSNLPNIRMFSQSSSDVPYVWPYTIFEYAIESYVADALEIARYNVLEALNFAWYEPVIQSEFYHPSFPPWYFVLGIMSAWGVWIAVRGAKVFRRYLQKRAQLTSRPDPVAVEYQRLMAMSAEAVQ